MSERKLVTLQQIESLEPIDGKDLIEVAHIKGWQTIVKKGEYKVGDFVFFFEIDSFIPVNEQFDFLRSRCFRSTTNLGDGYRIKSMKMGGVLSQGLIMPLSTLGFTTDFNNVIHLAKSHLIDSDNEYDFTEYFKVQKYEKPISARLAGQVKGNFPSFLRKTDQERIQGCFGKLQHKWIDYTWEATLKLDGSSMTMYYYNDGTEIKEGVCSRNLDLKTNEENTDNVFVKMWNKYNNTLKQFCEHNGVSLALQGELMGPSVQGNREKLPAHEFYVFDIFNITEQKYFNANDRKILLELLDIQSVPVLSCDMKFDTNITLNDLLKMSDIKSINHNIAEGIVYKSIDNPEISFKCINNRYLLNCDTED